MLNTPAYDTSAILWRKRATQQLEISAYHYMTPVCLHVHARHIETAKHHCSRPKTMLPIKTYFMQLYHYIQENILLTRASWFSDRETTKYPFRLD